MGLEHEELSLLGWVFDSKAGTLLFQAGISATEHVALAFSPMHFSGIRSLPNALSPEFRNLLYEELAKKGAQNLRGHALVPGYHQRKRLSSPHRSCAA